jgi:hypothetical protein
MHARQLFELHDLLRHVHLQRRHQHELHDELQPMHHRQLRELHDLLRRMHLQRRHDHGLQRDVLPGVPVGGLRKLHELL